MGRWRVIAAALILALPWPAYARSVAPQTGVISYPASYFAAANPSNAYDMIRRLPGFTFDDGGSARGFAGDAGNVVIDGQRPTAKTDTLQSILERIPASEVARIELIRGGAPGINMHGHTVLADVIRKKAASTTIVATASTNLWATGHEFSDFKLDYTHQNDGWLYEAAIERTSNFDDAYGDGIHILADAAGHVTRQQAHYTGGGSGWQFNGALTMPLFAGSLKTNLTLQESPNRSAFDFRAPGSKQRIAANSGTHAAELGLHYTRTWTGLALNARLLQRLEHDTAVDTSDAPGNVQVFAQTNNSGESIARATLRYTGIKSLALEAGGEAVFNFLDGKSTYTANGVPIALPGADAYVDEKRGEVFVEGTWTISPHWTLLAGTRFEFSTIEEAGANANRRSLFYPKPRVMLTWSPDKDTQIRLRVEKTVGQLDFTNFVASSDLSASGVSAGNSGLLPDQHMQYKLSFERHFLKKGALVVSLLHDDITDVVDRIPVTGPGGVFDAPGNIGNGRDDEINVETSLPLDWMGITGGLLKTTAIFRYSQVTDPVTHEARSISGQRPQEIDVSFSQDLKSLHSTWGIDFFNCWDERYYRVSQYEARHVLPPYLDVYWEYKPDADWAFHAEVDNLVPFVFKQSVVTYSGERGSSPVAQIERFAITSKPRIFFRIVRTFG